MPRYVAGSVSPSPGKNAGYQYEGCAHFQVVVPSKCISRIGSLQATEVAETGGGIVAYGANYLYRLRGLR